VDLLNPYRVLDLADQRASLCGRLLAELGADVLKVEPREGEEGRRLAPFAGEARGTGESLHFAYHNAGKRAVTLDLETASGRALFRALVARADVVVESFAPGYLDARDVGPSAFGVGAGSPLLWCSVTPYGAVGPRANEPAGSMVSLAAAGVMRITGTPEGGPCDAPGALAHEAAAVYAAFGLLLAARARAAGAGGVWLDLSIQECALASLYPIAPAHYDYHETLDTRAGRALDIFVDCVDGPPVMVYPITLSAWEALVDWLERPDVLADPAWRDIRYRRVHADLLYAFLVPLGRSLPALDFFRQGQRLGIPTSPVYAPTQFLADPHEQVRAFARAIPDGAGGASPFPAAPYRVDGAPPLPTSPAPRLGQHNREIYGGELGLTAAELRALRACGAI
jgi:crotonobetainyl-CoA:carnitine CoA-transferase CaiB-like acyl-CoA transferase